MIIIRIIVRWEKEQFERKDLVQKTCLRYHGLGKERVKVIDVTVVVIVLGIIDVTIVIVINVTYVIITVIVAVIVGIYHE